MTDMEKLNTAKVWIEKLANGINPLNDEPVKEDDLINNVHISRCLFRVTRRDKGRNCSRKKMWKNVFSFF